MNSIRLPSAMALGLVVYALLTGCATGIASGPSASEHSRETGGVPAVAQEFEEFVGSAVRQQGFFPTWIDSQRGRVFLELPAPSPQELQAHGAGWLAECLYVEGLTRGLGSNAVGLDRGQVGPSRVLELREIAGRVFFSVPNLKYRALQAGAEERQATLESFASSVLWSAPVLARGPQHEVLIEWTDFLVRDAHASGRRLEASGGHWQLDGERSVLLADAALSFPDNLEFEAQLTFAGQDAGREVREVTPLADAVTLVQHHSFIRLPDAGYTPLVWDPRAGAFAQSFVDTSARPDQENVVRHAVRHRLTSSSAEEDPLIYYVDRGAPPAVRDALIEGASWWSAAFDAAGFPGAFRVELLPAGVHPLDVRYNVIQWVQRSSRGWSYGGGIQDPRTGEMLKGHVTLGALRVRQDCILFESLLGTQQTGSGSPNDPLEASYARLRQLAAHEVGHTLGLAHNFAASTYGRASVMDYPAPLVESLSVPDGFGRELSLARAYAVGIGEWDKFAIRHLYAELTPEEAGQRPLWVAEASARGLVYLSDADARPAGAADARGSLWDNGADALEGLRQVLEVRRLGLAEFDERRLEPGESTALFEERLVPLFFFHRYQVEAAAKLVGGREYQHALVGDAWAATQVVDAARQRQALELLLSTLTTTLELPPQVGRLLAPRTLLQGRRRELFEGRSAPLFDELSLAEGAARLVLQPLLVPERLQRVMAQKSVDAEQLGLPEIFDQLRQTCLAPNPALSSAQRAVLQHVLTDEMLALASNPEASPHLRALVESVMGEIVERWRSRNANLSADERALARLLERFLARESEWSASRPEARRLPPGSPIGCSRG